MAEEKEKKEEKNIFKVWTDSYTSLSKMWEDSYEKLYKPWIESTSELFEKASDISKDATPNKYKEFYDEWINTYQKTFGKFCPIPTLTANKESLEKLSASGEELSKLYKSWITELEENSKNTQELLKGDPDPTKYKECYDIWTKKYNKMFDEFITFASKENTKGIFENYLGIPDIFFENYLQTSKIWKDYYSSLCTPWFESVQTLFEKMADVKEEKPESYKEFYTAWTDIYKEIYGKYMPSKDMFDNFVQSSNIYLTMYKSWITTLEKMSNKAEELSKANPDAYKEFYNLWIKTYEKAFNNFFDDMPIAGPMKEMMEPIKNAAKIYTDMYIKTYKIWWAVR